MGKLGGGTHPSRKGSSLTPGAPEKRHLQVLHYTKKTCLTSRERSRLAGECLALIEQRVPNK